MALVTDLPQTLGVAGLQLKLMARKRFILVLATISCVSLLMDYQLRGSLNPVRLLVSSFLITDLLVIGMTCGLIAEDADLGTFPFVLAHGIDRRTFLTGKLLPVVGVAFLFSAVSHAATLGLSHPGEPLGIASASGRLAAACVLSLSRILVVAAVTAFMAVALTNRSKACIAALFVTYGVVYGLQLAVSARDSSVWFWETLLPWRDNFERAVDSVFSRGITIQTLAAAIVQPLVYAVIFGALALRVLRRRDLARGDF